MARLDQICTLNMGQSPDSASYNENGEGIPFFQGNADFGIIHPKVRVWCNAPTKIAHEGDILISVRAPIGALNIADRECCIGRGLAALAVNEALCDKDYLWYAIASKVDELNSKGTGSTFKAIGKNVLAETEIPLLDLTEQEKIAGSLKKVDELITLRKEQLAKLDRLVKSRFIELFGDPVTNEKNWLRLTLGDICEIGSSKRVFEKDYVPSGIPFFRTKEIVELSKGNPISTELFITEEHFAELKKSYGAPKKDDLLISAVGTIGTIWIVSGEYEFYFKDGNLIQIKASPNFNSIFMKYLLDELIANYKKEMSTGTAYSALTIAGLKKMLVYDVPLTLQEQFAAFVEQTDKSKLVIQQSLEKLELLKKSLMQEYFG